MAENRSADKPALDGVEGKEDPAELPPMPWFGMDIAERCQN